QPRGRIRGAQLDESAANGDIVAGFSSRGPAGHGFPVLKPDLTAPGVDIWAASATGVGEPTPEYLLMSGTSMSSPHVAGAAALLRALHPSWSPAEIKSALMTTALHAAALRKEDGTTPGDPFDVGSGRVRLAAAAQAGLLLDISFADYLAADPTGGGDPTRLNLPSLYDTDCGSQCMWTRTVRSTRPITTTWQSEYLGTGRATITPSTLVLAPSSSGTFTVTWSSDVSVQGSPQWYFGEVIWRETAGAAPDAHLPLAVWARTTTPDIAVAPVKLGATLNLNEQISQTLTITNSGDGPLTWVFTDVVSAPVVELWGQRKNGHSGIVSDFYTNKGGGTYTADDFTLTGDAHITLISAEGFQNNADLSNSATKLSWFVYPDAEGKPAGQPQDTGGTEMWKFSAAVDAPGVDVSNDVITLDLEAAGAPPLNLPAGDYWLVVFPDIDMSTYNRWNWSQGVPGGAEAHVIDPGDNFGQAGKGWQAISSDLGVSFTDVAFRIVGTIQVDCSLPEDIPWLSVSSQAGTVPGNDSVPLEVGFDSGGLSAGVYEKTLCIASNDPDEALVAVSTRLTVIEEGTDLVCNGTPVRFESGIPSSWQRITIQGEGWSTTAGTHCGSLNVPKGNFAGTGNAACVDSDATGGREEAYLCAPVAGLDGVAAAALRFRVNYQVFETPDPNDAFQVVVSPGAPGGPYDPPLFRINNDFPGQDAYAQPDSGADVRLDLGAYVGDPQVFVCFYYSGDNDWYAHIDDVALSCKAPDETRLFLPEIYRPEQTRAGR
ncbi:MAG: hypothetical protein D6775_14920, partial [Caldilineae bacterium]